MKSLLRSRQNRKVFGNTEKQLIGAMAFFRICHSSFKLYQTTSLSLLTLPAFFLRTMVIDFERSLLVFSFLAFRAIINMAYSVHIKTETKCQHPPFTSSPFFRLFRTACFRSMNYRVRFKLFNFRCTARLLPEVHIVRMVFHSELMWRISHIMLELAEKVHSVFKPVTQRDFLNRRVRIHQRKAGVQQTISD